MNVAHISKFKQKCSFTIPFAFRVAVDQLVTIWFQLFYILAHWQLAIIEMFFGRQLANGSCTTTTNDRKQFNLMTNRSTSHTFCFLRKQHQNTTSKFRIITLKWTNKVLIFMSKQTRKRPQVTYPLTTIYHQRIQKIFGEYFDHYKQIMQNHDGTDGEDNENDATDSSSNDESSSSSIEKKTSHPHIEVNADAKQQHYWN